MRKIKKTEDTKKRKEDFVKRFFPNCMNSPGGTQKLLPDTKINSADGKMISQSNLINSAVKQIPEFKLSRTVTQETAKINNKTSSHGLYIIDGQSELTTASGWRASSGTPLLST